MATMADFLSKINSIEDAFEAIKPWLKPHSLERPHDTVYMVLRHVNELGYRKGKKYEKRRIADLLGVID